MIYRKYDLRWHPDFCLEVQYLELALFATLNPSQYLQLGTNELVNFAGIHYFSNYGREDLQVAGNNYIACKYDGRWWIGLILKVDTVQLDAQVKFMHPPGPANTFFWPLKDDVCWVSLQQIFCKIATPITATGRSYTITVKDFTTIMDVHADE